MQRECPLAHLQELFAENTKTLKETTMQVMIHNGGLQWHIRTRGLARHSRGSQEYQTAKHHSWNAPHKNFKGCADGREDADYRKCMQEDCYAYETIESWGKVASGRRKTHNMMPQQRVAQFGNQWNVVQTSAGGSTPPHPEHGKSSPRSTELSISALGDRLSSWKFLYAGTVTAK